jgi:hypothetical protein
MERAASGDKSSLFGSIKRPKIAGPVLVVMVPAGFEESGNLPHYTTNQQERAIKP